ncbi:MAG: hypothetical protein ABI867_13775 [Kofleriaceae bacterium]
MRWIVVAIVLATRLAAAESPRLVEAREAIAAIRYDRARELLDAALRAGDSSPAALAEIYRLSAHTAIVLGDRDTAVQYYRCWLALEPQAALPSSVSPKLREPFVAAQADMAARGGITATATRTTTSVTVTVVDPLAMATTVAIGNGARGKLVDGAAVIAVPVATAVTGIAVLDGLGNHLIELGGVELASVPAPPPPIDKPAPRAARGWKLWLVSTGVLLGSGVVLDRLARQDRGFFDPTAATRRERYTLAANLAFAGAGVCAIVTAVLYARRPKAMLRIAPTPTGVAVNAIW